MNYVASHTNIPLPKVHAVHLERDGRIFIEMAYIQGDTLDGVWKHLSPSQKGNIFADLKHYISCLRGLDPPVKDIVSSALQNPAIDYRVGERFFGPVNHADFHSVVRGHCVMEDVAQYLSPEVVQTHTGRLYETKFTHADLVPRNIIVKDGRVAAIIDWAFAGWYPEYWEFTKANYTMFRGQEWMDFLSELLPGYETELAAERVLWRVLPEQGGRYTSTSRDGVTVEWPGSNPSAAWVEARKKHPVDDLWAQTLELRGYEGFKK